MIEKPKILEEFIQRFSEATPDAIKELPKDVQEKIKKAMTVAFSKLDVVTREEFDVHVNVLQRTREKVDELEKKIANK